VEAPGHRTERFQRVVDRTGGPPHLRSLHAIAGRQRLHRDGARRTGTRGYRRDFCCLPGKILPIPRSSSKSTIRRWFSRCAETWTRSTSRALRSSAPVIPHGLGMADRLSCDLAARGPVIFSDAINAKGKTVEVFGEHPPDRPDCGGGGACIGVSRDHFRRSPGLSHSQPHHQRHV